MVKSRLNRTAAAAAIAAASVAAKPEPSAWLGIQNRPLLRAMFLIATHRSAEAVPLLDADAARGNTIAPLWLARLMAGRMGVKRDGPEAMRWAVLAAAEGSHEALATLGRIYLDRPSTAKRPFTADAYFAWAARGGCEAAFTLLQNSIRVNPVTPAERSTLLGVFLRAAGTPNGKCALATLYSMGLLVRRDPGRSVSLLELAASTGSGRAMAQLGRAYLSGYVVPKNTSLAVKWLRRAAQAGSPLGMVGLAMLYADGTGVTKNQRLSWYWTRQAAEHGDPAMMSSLGREYALRAMVDGRWGRAARWYLRSIASGYRHAERRLRSLLKLRKRFLPIQDSPSWQAQFRGG